MSKSLHIVARHANALEDVERFGKNDPYARFLLNVEDKNPKKTSVKKNAGKNVEWEETVVLDNYDPSSHHNLFVEVLDSETLGDEPIGFTSIPLNQVNDAQGKSFKGKFDLYDDDSKAKGTISLTISVIDSDRAGAHITNDNPEVKGVSTLTAEHQKRFKSIKRKEQAGDLAAAAAVIGGLAAGKALLGGGDKAPKA
ncbi:MAG: C2 domain-containing protein [Benniella sp.]|nr:MAG: C2 domain-containing protein [Benniella sp.]